MLLHIASLLTFGTLCVALFWIDQTGVQSVQILAIQECDLRSPYKEGNINRLSAKQAQALGEMTRLPKANEELRKGAWDAEEDEKLRKYVETHGTGHWRSVGKRAGDYSYMQQA